MRAIVRAINRSLQRNPGRALEPAKIGVRGKNALSLDAVAEFKFEEVLHGYHRGRFSKIEVYGEETLRNASLELKPGDGPCVLVDAVDGTDLVERFMGNWCTAAVFYNPGNDFGKKIMASIVGLPNLDVYFATSDEAGAWVHRPGRGVQPTTVQGPTNVTAVEDASVCFYGQKPENLLQATSSALFRSKGSLPFRIYTLAGIPMMMKLIDHRVKVQGVHGIDAVFDIGGQKPHDVVPGAFIALKAGAKMTDLSGKRIDELVLEKSLLRPAAEESELKYVLAGTEELCEALRRRLTSSS